MVEVVPIVQLWRMPLTWCAHSSASDGTLVLLWNTTSVVAEVVHVVLLPLLFQFLKACFSIASWSWSCRRNITSGIPNVLIKLPVEFGLADFFIRVRILFPHNVVVSA